MKKLLISLAALALVAGSAVQCSKYDDTELRDEIQALREELDAQKGQIKALQTLSDNNKAIRSVTENEDGTYTINFYDNTSITLGTGSGSGTIDGKYVVSIEVQEEQGQGGGPGGAKLVITYSDGSQVTYSIGGGPGGQGPDNGDPNNPNGGGDSEWAGTYTLNGVAFEVKASGSNLVVSSGAVSFTLTPNGNNYQYAVSQYGWVGSDSAGNNYYFYAYDASNTYLNVADGTVLIEATRAANGNLVFAAPAGSAVNALYIGIYASDGQTWVGWFENGVSLLGTLTRNGGDPNGGNGGGQEGEYALEDYNGDWIINNTTACSVYTYQDDGTTYFVIGSEAPYLYFPTQFVNGELQIFYPQYGYVGSSDDNTTYYYAYPVVPLGDTNKRIDDYADNTLLSTMRLTAEGTATLTGADYDGSAGKGRVSFVSVYPLTNNAWGSRSHVFYVDGVTLVKQ